VRFTNLKRAYRQEGPECTYFQIREKNSFSVEPNVNVNKLPHYGYLKAPPKFSRLVPVIEGSSHAQEDSQSKSSKTKNAYNFEPCHVPQIFWKKDYDTLFAPLFAGWGEFYARRVCSAVLVKLCGDYTWAHAATLLNLPERKTKGLGNWLMTMLTQTNQKKLFAERLPQVVARLEQRLPYAQKLGDYFSSL
jgi:hypothetical protein